MRSTIGRAPPPLPSPLPRPSPLPPLPAWRPHSHSGGGGLVLDVQLPAAQLEVEGGAGEARGPPLLQGGGRAAAAAQGKQAGEGIGGLGAVRGTVAKWVAAARAGSGRLAVHLRSGACASVGKQRARWATDVGGTPWHSPAATSGHRRGGAVAIGRHVEARQAVQAATRVPPPRGCRMLLLLPVGCCCRCRRRGARVCSGRWRVGGAAAGAQPVERAQLLTQAKRSRWSAAIGTPERGCAWVERAPLAGERWTRHCYRCHSGVANRRLVNQNVLARTSASVADGARGSRRGERGVFEGARAVPPVGNAGAASATPRLARMNRDADGGEWQAEQRRGTRQRTLRHKLRRGKGARCRVEGMVSSGWWCEEGGNPKKTEQGQPQEPYSAWAAGRCPPKMLLRDLVCASEHEEGGHAAATGWSGAGLGRPCWLGAGRPCATEHSSLARPLAGVRVTAY